jgi:hypothetical protein
MARRKCKPDFTLTTFLKRAIVNPLRAHHP